MSTLFEAKSDRKMFKCLFQLLQELRCKEDELNQKQMQQLEFEERLMKIKEELDAKALELLEKELQQKMQLLTQNTPTPKKRRGKFSKARLKVSNVFMQ